MEFMTKFEAVLLLSPDISTTVRNDIISSFDKIILDNSGTIINSEDWGLRDLSYKINNFSKAFYNFFQIEIDGTTIDYKDTKLLSRYVSEKGKIVPSRITNVSRSKQLELSKAIKRARFLALMSFTSKSFY